MAVVLVTGISVTVSADETDLEEELESVKAVQTLQQELSSSAQSNAAPSDLPKAQNIDLDMPIEATPPANEAEIEQTLSANEENTPQAPLPEANAPSTTTETPESLTDTTADSAEKPPKAPDIDLQMPIVEAQKETIEEENTAESAIDDVIHQTSQQTVTEPPATDQGPLPEDAIEQAKSMVLLGKEVQPGIATRLSWSPSQSFEGIATPTPVLVAHGSKPGPTLCLTASIHGDELNGIEIVRRVLYNIKAEKLSGTVIGVPIVNLQGFHRASRYLSDRRDLNRFFPGNPDGSSAARIAYSFFNQVVKHCDALVDLHTGSFYRTNLPQLRADLTKPEVVELTHGFGATVVLHSEGAEGTLRNSAVNAGIPAVTLEAGGPMQLQEDAVDHGVKGIQTLLNKLGMYKKISFWGDPEPVYYQSEWIRAHEGGILFSEVKLGERVRQGTLLGTVTNPITNVKTELISPHNGRVLGMAINQVVQPGFAAFRIGIQREEEDVIQQPEPTSPNLVPAPEIPNVEDEPDLAKAGTEKPDDAEFTRIEDSE